MNLEGDIEMKKMREQTYITFLKDVDDNTICFERWDCKRESTCVRNLRELAEYPIYRKDFEKAAYIAVYKTEADGDKLVRTIDKDDFLSMR